ncbi:MAG TPA: transposase, partial [Anaerolineales bacterium]|nr:transposase [Anaerolineales bacterium]
QIQGLDQKIDEYLEQLDQADEEEKDVHKPSAEELREKIEAMKGRRAKLREMQGQLKESGQSQISLTDPDSRAMPVGGGEATLVGFNVQLSVDAKHKLIVDHDVTHEVTDLGLLSRMAKSAKEALGVDAIDVVADRGYYDGKEVKACLQEGITPYIEKPNTSANRKRGLFTKEDFRYDPDQDCYGCPAGQALTFRFQTVEQEREIRYYATRACRECALKPNCTGNQRGRRITRWVDEHLLEAMQARLQAEPEKVGLRKQLAEHPFGTIKHAWNQGHFLTRGLPNVRAEMALTVLAYNLKRAIKILGVSRMVAALA